MHSWQSLNIDEAIPRKQLIYKVTWLFPKYFTASPLPFNFLQEVKKYNFDDLVSLLLQESHLVQLDEIILASNFHHFF